MTRTLNNKIRILDILISTMGLVFLLPIILIILLAGFLDTGSPLFFQRRLGVNRTSFLLVKFRTMAKNTKTVTTHLVDPNAVTRFGGFLRRSKLDELPQLWNVLKGEMSLVGPRPGLPNDGQLTNARQKRGVFAVRPGITGLSQLDGIDMSKPDLLAETDAKMISEMSLRIYFKFLVLTLLGRGAGDQVRN